jgi:hypothetical protein
MRKTRYAVVLAIPVLIGAGGGGGGAPGHPTDLLATRETARIRTHLATVERELRAKDVSSLASAQRAARSRNLDVLHEYWMRGIFPRNTDFPGERVPYFIDRYGTRCAMAYLIEQSGHGGGDFVARVAATHNNARIWELQDDPVLVAWLDQNGMTLAEAAQVQPSYAPCCVIPSQPNASAGYKTTTALSVSLNATTLVLNTASIGVPRRLTGLLGILTGVAGIAAGEPNLHEGGQRHTLGLLNAGIGTASGLLGVYRLVKVPRAQSYAKLAPWVDARGKGGLSMHFSF